MKDVKYETLEEKRMIEGIQKAYGAKQDGIIGNQTLSDIAKAVAPEVLPLTLILYGMPVIISKDILPFSPKASLRGFSNSISGSFTYPRAKYPCSVLVSHGEDIYASGSKAWAGFRESVIVRYNDNTTKIMRILNTFEIPYRQNVKWAVGGMGLLGNYNPELEGYRAFKHDGTNFNHGDVLRKTHHTVLGIKDNFCYLVFVKNMTGGQVNNFCKDKLKLDMAVMLDGGTDIPAINGAELFAKINLNRIQGYAIQAI